MAAVDTTMAEPSGSPAEGPSAIRLPDGKWRACSTEHITGSQATVAPPLTCLVIHFAACCLAAEAAATPRLPDGPPEPWPAADDVPTPLASATVRAPAAKTTTIRMITLVSRRRIVTEPFRRESGSTWRSSQSRAVVPITCLQGGVAEASGSRSAGLRAGLGAGLT